jgi:hypothetical protein
MTILKRTGLTTALLVGAILFLLHWAGTTWDKWDSAPDGRAQLESQRKSTMSTSCDCGTICSAKHHCGLSECPKKN